MAEAARQVAFKALKKGMNIKDVADLSGLTEHEIKELIEKPN